MLHQEMAEDTVSLLKTEIEADIQTDIIINNRAGGNAPLIAQHIAERVIEASGIA